MNVALYDCKRDWAYGRGSDARLAGLPLYQNPYISTSLSAWAWRQGWLNVEHHWAEEAKWPYRKLCPLKSLQQICLEQSSREAA